MLKIQLAPEGLHSSSGTVSPVRFPERVADEGLQECNNNLDLTIEKLGRHM